MYEEFSKEMWNTARTDIEGKKRGMTKYKKRIREIERERDRERERERECEREREGKGRKKKG